MAETKSTKKEQPMLDPIAYRSNYSEDNIIWNDKATTEVTGKYEGEGADNVYNPYNKDIKIADLDPNYQYWQPAKEINAVDDKYITTRNDNIASALYNEWKVNYNDVVSFLQWQQNWFNSTEEERNNTTSNVWNRLGQISAENQKTEKTDNQKWADTSKMESDLNKSTSATIYWKDTAQEWDPTKGIKTNEDVNSPFKIMEEARIAKVESLAGMDSIAIAATMFTWEVPYGEQAMSDLQKWMPEKYAEIQNYYKKLVGQANVDAITSGWEMTTTADRTDTTTQTTSYAVNNATLSVSATQLLKSIDTILDSSDTAKSANDLMWSIENDMAKLKNRLMNLKKEANTVFKWDAPDYLVKAYINNRTQEIQNQLSILEDRYNAAYDRYKTELSHAEWQSELDLKRESLALENYLDNYGWTSWTNKSNYTVAERNNNPTNMTVDFMKIVWAELWVDYEVWTDSFINSNWKRQYYAKLIWDPVETTIRVLDKALANWVNPFTTTSWSYIWKLWLTKEKWQNMTKDEKVEMIKKWLPYEGWSMENMAYYVSQWGNTSYDDTYASTYEKYLSWDYSKSWLETQAKAMWKSLKQIDAEAKAWKADEDKKIEESLINKPSVFVRKDWEEFDMSDTPTYDSLTYDQKNIVQQLINLNKNPSTVTKRQYWDDFERILSAVKEINPYWSDADFWQADKVKKEWNTSSKNGSNSRNGTAIATAKDIYDIADEFGNVKWKDWNGMLNKLKDKLSDEKYTELLINLEVLASEYAWALKGNNAAPTEQEIADKKEILAANLWAWAMKEAAIQVARTLYNKNANEADNYYKATLVRPPLIVTKDVADWMYSTAWITWLAELYQYVPPKWSSNKWPNAPEIDTSKYKWKSIWDAISG